MGQFSRLAIEDKRSLFDGVIRIALFSLYSAPQISKTDKVSSPTLSFQMSHVALAGSTISFSTFPFPPAP